MEKKLREKLPSGKFENVPAVHSKRMGAIKGKGNRTTELRFKMALVKAGIRNWRMNPRDIIGKPDFFFPNSRVAVFIDGCFWHGCSKCGHIPTKNRPFWAEKIRRNQERDKEKSQLLRSEGIGVLRFWEHELQGDLESCIQELNIALFNRKGNGI